MTEYILSIDPGWSSGIAFIGYDKGNVWLEETWQFSDGLTGMARWVSEHTDVSYGNREGWILGSNHFSSYLDGVTVITEKFTARRNEGFSYTTVSLEALRVEGGLIWDGLMPEYTPKEKRWRDPKFQYVVGGKDKVEKKKRLHAFLKDSGTFYVTGKQVGQPNADDVRSAIGHGLAYLARDLKHGPAFQLISKWGEKN